MAHSDSQRSHTASSQLVPLSRLTSFRMADGEPDVRGWPVVAADGAALGRVVELLVDPATSEIAAILIATPQSGSAQGGGRSVLPMEHVHIDDRQDRLVADAAGLTGYADEAQAASTADSAAASAVNGADLSRATTSRDANGDEVIRVPVVEERLVVEKRPVVTEMLVIRKRAVQTSRVVEADLRRERVEVDQRDFRDGEQRPAR